MTKTKLVEKVTTEISAGYQVRISTTYDALREKREALETAIVEFNEQMAAKWADVESVLNEYNETVEAANELRQEIADEMQSYYDDKSEKWQEGDKGQAYLSWMGEWSGDFITVEMDAPDPVDFDGEDLVTVLGEDLPFEVPE